MARTLLLRICIRALDFGKLSNRDYSLIERGPLLKGDSKATYEDFRPWLASIKVQIRVTMYRLVLSRERGNGPLQ